MKRPKVYQVHVDGGVSESLMISFPPDVVNVEGSGFDIYHLLDRKGASEVYRMLRRAGIPADALSVWGLVSVRP